MGRTLEEFLTANIQLFQCGITAGALGWSILVIIGVMSPVALWLFFMDPAKRQKSKE